MCSNRGNLRIRYKVFFQICKKYYAFCTFLVIDNFRRLWRASILFNTQVRFSPNTSYPRWINEHIVWHRNPDIRGFASSFVPLIATVRASFIYYLWIDFSAFVFHWLTYYFDDVVTIRPKYVDLDSLPSSSNATPSVHRPRVPLPHAFTIIINVIQESKLI